MLTFDLPQMTEHELRAAVFVRCGRFGDVLSVKVVRDDDDRHRARAAVLMSSVEEAARLHFHVGDSMHGRVVFIDLRRERRFATFVE